MPVPTVGIKAIKTAKKASPRALKNITVATMKIKSIPKQINLMESLSSFITPHSYSSAFNMRSHQLRPSSLWPYSLER